jgi:hypothetical protein
MTDYIGLHEQYALVPPQTFVDRFAQRWTSEYQMPASEPLRRLWGTMARTYQEAILAAALGHPSRWRVLQPPTGSGKTMGAVVYSGLQAQLNVTAEADGVKPVGIMIVTRLKAQADEVVSNINAYAGHTVAIADHTDHRATPDQLHDSDIVVITHQAYVNAKQTLSGVRADRWARITSWRGGKRLLTIVDEALANVVEESQVKLDSLGMVIGYIPHEVRLAHEPEVTALETLYEAMGHHVGLNEGFGFGTSLAWPEGGAPCTTDLTALRAAMSALRYDKFIGKDDDDECKRIARRTDKTLAAAEAVLDQYAYLAQKGNEHSLNSSALAVPFDVPGPVVLDATARADFLYTLLEDRAEIIPTPPGVRDYGNVRLHVAWTKDGIGKGKMVEHAKPRFSRLRADLEERLTPERMVFFCVHKDVEHQLPERDELPFAETAYAHWGAVDGSNEYKHFDTAVIFGLPFRDTIWATNAFFAIQGVQDDDWLDNPTWKNHPNVREKMIRRQLSASIIQAIGRIRLRKVIDVHGRCEPADVFIVLPSGDRGTDILADIRRDLPGIEVVDWPFELDGPKVRVRSSGSLPHERLLTFMKNRQPGRTSMNTIAREFGLKPHAKKDLQKVLRAENHETTLALRALGVTYGSEGRGAGAKSFLLKMA